MAQTPAAALAQTSDQAPQPAPTTTIDTQQQAEKSGHLFGDWLGVRTALSHSGLDVTAGYVSEFGANVAGGLRQDATESGQFSIDTKLDLDRAFGWRGATFHTSISYRRGYNLATRSGLNTLLQPQEVFGRGQALRLSESWLGQRIGIVDMAVSRLALGQDFAAQPCEFMNLTFCGNQQGNLVGDYWYNYPISQWGARVKINLGGWYAMAGIYEYNPNNLLPGLALNRGGAQGVTAPGELGWTRRLGARGLPGLYRIGGWYSTAQANDVLSDASGRPFGLTGQGPALRSGRYGGYILLQQQLTGSFEMGPDGPRTIRGLNIFINFTQVDRRTSRLGAQQAVWLTYTGPSSSRRSDEIGFAVGRNLVNGRAADAAVIAEPGSDRPKAEYPIELFYAAHLTGWLTVSPNIQYIVHPGGFSRVSDVVVLGAKSGLTF